MATKQIRTCDNPGCSRTASKNCMACAKDLCDSHAQAISVAGPQPQRLDHTKIDVPVCGDCGMVFIRAFANHDERLGLLIDNVGAFVRTLRETPPVKGP